MSNPNLLSLSAVNILSKSKHLTNSNLNIIDAITTGHVTQVDSLLLVNLSTVNTVDAYICHYDASDTITGVIANSITLAAKSTLDVINRPIMLNEGDCIFGKSSVANGIDAIASWKDMSS